MLFADERAHLGRGIGGRADGVLLGRLLHHSRIEHFDIESYVMNYRPQTRRRTGRRWSGARTGGKSIGISRLGW